jgi:5'(3')-deoxyribonucleotidase
MIATITPRPIFRPRGKVIAVDIDEVLCPLLKPMMKWKQFEPGEGDEFSSHVYAAIRKMSEDETTNEFYHTDEFASTSPIKGAQAGVAYLKARGHRLYAVTERHPAVRPRTESWLDMHFPFAFDDVLFTGPDTPKSNVCTALNVGLIIDDNIQICRECETRHIRSVNFIGDPVYPWCTENDISVKRWDDIICSTNV